MHINVESLPRIMMIGAIGLASTILCNPGVKNRGDTSRLNHRPETQSPAAGGTGAPALIPKPQTKSRDSSFNAFSDRVLDAVRTFDWQRLHAYSNPDLVVALVRRLYDIDMTNQMKAQQRASALGALSDGESDQYVVATRTIRLDHTGIADDLQILRRFARGVNESYGHSPAWVVQSRDLVSDECELFRGPAIEGKVVSNMYWRVQFERRGSGWIVRSLVFETH